MTPSVQTTRYQTKTRLWILSISCIVPGLFPVFSLLKADMSISRVAKLCDVIPLYCEVSSLALIHSMDVLEKNDRGSRIRNGGSGIDVTGSIIMKSSIFFEKNENLNCTLWKWLSRIMIEQILDTRSSFSQFQFLAGRSSILNID